MCNFKYGDIVKVDDGSHDGFFDGKIGYFIRIDAQNPKKAEIVFFGEEDVFKKYGDVNYIPLQYLRKVELKCMNSK